MESLSEGSSGALDSNAWQMTAVLTNRRSVQAGAGLAFDEHRVLPVVRLSGQQKEIIASRALSVRKSDWISPMNRSRGLLHLSKGGS